MVIHSSTVHPSRVGREINIAAPLSDVAVRSTLSRGKFVNFRLSHVRITYFVCVPPSKSVILCCGCSSSQYGIVMI